MVAQHVQTLQGCWAHREQQLPILQQNAWGLLGLTRGDGDSARGGAGRELCLSCLDSSRCSGSRGCARCHLHTCKELHPQPPTLQQQFAQSLMPSNTEGGYESTHVKYSIEIASGGLSSAFAYYWHCILLQQAAAQMHSCLEMHFPKTCIADINSLRTQRDHKTPPASSTADGLHPKG